MSKTTKKIFSRRMAAVLGFGISSGIPLLLIGSTLKAWMKEENIDLTVIGVFALVGLPYTLKFLWAPLFDRFSLPFLGRRRGWILVFQVCLMIALAAMGSAHPGLQPSLVAVIAFAIALFAASQDIVIDAYRREVLHTDELGFGSSLAVNGYRIGMLLAGAVALPLADQVGWHLTYFSMAALYLPLIALTLIAPATDARIARPHTLREAVVEPFVDYFRRPDAIEILVFILLYKIGDQMASDMFTPFYLDIGFTKTEIGVVSKFFGFWATIIGGLAGGLAMLRLGMFRSLWLFGILQAVSTLGFSAMAWIGHSNAALAAVVTFENVASGMGSAAYVAFMAALCNRRFTATQFALLSSLMGVPRVFFGSTSGLIAKQMGWMVYFTFCAAVALPGLIMLTRARRWRADLEVPSGESL